MKELTLFRYEIKSVALSPLGGNVEKSKGQICYEAYMESSGSAMPPWGYLLEEAKEHWEVAANAVVDAVLAE